MKSLHEQHGEKAIGVLQGIMKQLQGINISNLKGFDIIDKGNHFVISKGNKSMEVGLYASGEVFKALNTFCN